MMMDTPRVSARKGGQAFSVGFGGGAMGGGGGGGGAAGGGALSNKRGNENGAKKKISSSGPFKFLRKDTGQRADSAHEGGAENGNNSRQQHHQHSFQRDNSLLHDMKNAQHHDPFAMSEVALPKRTPAPQASSSTQQKQNNNN